MDSVRPFEDWSAEEPERAERRPSLSIVPDGALLPDTARRGVALPRCPLAHRGPDMLSLCAGYQPVSLPESGSLWVHRLPPVRSCTHLGLQESRRGQVTACSNPEWRQTWGHR
jgi:hypothetical protein